VHLGPIEFRILELLLREPGRAYTRAQIVEAVWGPGAIVDERNVDAQIARLRRALVRDVIRTVRGYGYSFNEVPPAPPAI
jgi:two-component system phosphate regulon response regulator PhoB